MKFIIKLFSEITIKSSPVRKRMMRQLRKNIRRVCRPIDDLIAVRGEWDLIHVDTALTSPAELQQLTEKLCCIPGICLVMEVLAFPLIDFEAMSKQTLKLYEESIKGKTFAVRVKRSGDHSFTSVEAERYLGNRLNTQTEAAGVDLSNPDITVNIEIKNNHYFMVKARHKGPGGFPLGTQSPVLSLISGGFDSAVASFLTTKRGMNTHYCFFNLGGYAHEVSVKEVAFYLWEKYGASHSVRFITVPFQEVVEQIINRVDPSQMGVILKRMMLRAAAAVADKMDIQALVTGEAIAQVSSQTLPNLSVIDSVTDMLVIRPLITMDKQDIIKIASQIGTEEFSKKIPEYCAVISKKPTTRANPDRIIYEESKMDFSILDSAVENYHDQSIMEIMSRNATVSDKTALISKLKGNDIVVDIRHSTEKDIKPLRIENHEHLEIPFYKLEGEVPKLNSKYRYLLFCDKGIMSRLHAEYLFDKKYNNIGVYIKDKEI